MRTKAEKPSFFHVKNVFLISIKFSIRHPYFEANISRGYLSKAPERIVNDEQFTQRYHTSLCVWSPRSAYEAQCYRSSPA